MPDVNYLTAEGLEKLKKEVAELKGPRRQELSARLRAAIQQGDLSENAEYVAAREELSFTDGRIEELEELLREVVLIEDGGKSGSKGTVKLGATVVLKIDGKKEEFTVVGEWEADPANKKISHESPLGKALIGKSIGDHVEVQAPAGKVVYTILSVN